MFSELTISVRSLVEFLLRSGDLESGSAGGADIMQEGSKMHRMIQKAAGPEYLAEVPLEIAYRFPARQDALSATGPAWLDGVTVIVQGRADGILTGTIPPDATVITETPPVPEDVQEEDGEPGWIIDEIKSSYRSLRSIREPEPVHLAQAKVYAYIYAAQNGLEQIMVRMTYANLLTKGTKYFYGSYTFDELETWFTGLMEEYRKWAEYTFEWRAKRTDSVKTLPFPYPYRDGQKDLAAGVYRTIVHGRKLFLEAPTGTGKTISTLFPAVKAMGEGKAEKIFYLTAKTITRTAAENTIADMRAKGLLLKSVVLTAKEKMCILEKPSCNPEECPRAKGHYDRVNEALYALLTESDNFSRNQILSYAERYNVCPFELGLDASLFADTVIGDYNYLFDPHAYLRRFFGEGVSTKNDYIFLIDEAHNLVERGRDMYSAEICKEDILAQKKAVKELYPNLEKALSKCNKVLLSMKKEALLPDPGGEAPELTVFPDGGCRVLAEIDRLADSLYEIQAVCEGILYEERINEQAGRKRSEEEVRRRKEIWSDFLNFYFDIKHFIQMNEKRDDHFVIYEEERPGGRFVVKLYCVDPSRLLKECMDRGRASILFSATLLPITYYKSLLGGTAEDYEVYAKSVFRPEKQGVFIVRDLTSRYKRRGQEEYSRIAGCIRAVTGQRHGNYMVFFPSFLFMKNVADILEEELLSEECEDVTLIRQESRMDESRREEFLKRFEDISDEKSLIGLCVLGGIFSEGIDLKNDSLIGVVIVGTGIPQVCSERELLMKHFEGDSTNGYDYAYRFPGMNKVLQAAGRVIRTSEDVGIVALLDERFVTPSYRRMFPREWQNLKILESRDAPRAVERFWDEWL